MIGVKDAIEIIKSSSIKLPKVEVNLVDSLSHCLAEDMFSTMDLPPFSQSAMDGYALGGDFDSYNVVGEVKAGDTVSLQVKQGEAFRIFTGGKIPTGTTAIAKQEIVVQNENRIRLTEEVKPGTSIRKKGEELSLGGLVMKKMTLINPAAIGLLSSLGLQKVNVIRKPKIALVVTGNELTQLGDELLPG